MPFLPLTAMSQHGPGDGQGATFTIRLPVAQNRVEAPGVHADAERRARMVFQPPHRLRNIRIIVVDDEAEALDLLTTILTQAAPL